MLKTGFMELLKDKGMVPQDEVVKSEAHFAGFFSALRAKVDTEFANRTANYMTLLADKGYVPVSPANDNWYAIIHSNDNETDQRVAL